MKESLGKFLMPLSDSLLALVSAVPLSVVRLMFLGLLLFLALWVIRLRPQMPREGEGRRSLATDLRTFAVVLLALQSLCYIVF